MPAVWSLFRKGGYSETYAPYSTLAVDGATGLAEGGTLSREYTLNHPRPGLADAETAIPPASVRFLAPTGPASPDPKITKDRMD